MERREGEGRHNLTAQGLSEGDDLQSPQPVMPQAVPQRLEEAVLIGCQGSKAPEKKMKSIFSRNISSLASTWQR